MDSILFKLVINYYYLWNEALFKQKKPAEKTTKPAH